jgi:hypothetical protein
MNGALVCGAMPYVYWVAGVDMMMMRIDEMRCYCCLLTGDWVIWARGYGVGLFCQCGYEGGWGVVFVGDESLLTDHWPVGIWCRLVLG